MAFWANLLANIRLKLKEGTHSTLLSIKLSFNLTTPTCETSTFSPLGNNTWDALYKVISVYKCHIWIIWCEAPMSTIQGTCEFSSTLTKLVLKHKRLPVKLASFGF